MCSTAGALLSNSPNAPRHRAERAHAEVNYDYFDFTARHLTRPGGPTNAQTAACPVYCILPSPPVGGGGTKKRASKFYLGQALKIRSQDGDWPLFRHISVRGLTDSPGGRGPFKGSIKVPDSVEGRLESPASPCLTQILVGSPKKKQAQPAFTAKAKRRWHCKWRLLRCGASTFLSEAHKNKRVGEGRGLHPLLYRRRPRKVRSASRDLCHSG